MDSQITCMCLAITSTIGGGHIANNQCLVVCVHSDIEVAVKNVVPFKNNQGPYYSNSMKKVCDFEDSLALFCVTSLA